MLLAVPRHKQGIYLSGIFVDRRRTIRNPFSVSYAWSLRFAVKSFLVHFPRVDFLTGNLGCRELRAATHFALRE